MKLSRPPVLRQAFFLFLVFSSAGGDVIDSSKETGFNLSFVKGRGKCKMDLGSHLLSFCNLMRFGGCQRLEAPFRIFRISASSMFSVLEELLTYLMVALTQRQGNIIAP